MLVSFKKTFPSGIVITITQRFIRDTIRRDKVLLPEHHTAQRSIVTIILNRNVCIWSVVFVNDRIETTFCIDIIPEAEAMYRSCTGCF